MARFINELKRTHRCGELRASDIRKEVVLFGWVQSRRDFGGLVFVDLRDRDGLTQVVFDPEAGPRPTRWPTECAPNGSLAIRGAVRLRGQQFSKKEGKMVSTINPKIATGEIEVIVHEATIFNRAETPTLRERMTTSTPARRCASSTATSTCAAPPLQRSLATPRDQPH